MTADAVLADWDAAFNSAACETAADLFTPDATYVDHRPLGWPPLHGREAIRAWYVTMANVISMNATSTLVVDQLPWIVGEQVFRFTAPAADGGGEGEVTLGALLCVEDGLIARLELYDSPQEAVSALQAQP